MNRLYSFKTGVRDGIVFTTGLLSIFGFIFIVRGAPINPGVISNPTFSPTQSDVRATYPLNCTILGANQAVNCPVGFQLTGAGVDCSHDDDNHPMFSLDTQGGPNNTGRITGLCSGSGAANVYAICCQTM